MNFPSPSAPQGSQPPTSESGDLTGDPQTDQPDKKAFFLQLAALSALIITMEYSLDVVTELLKKRICSNQDPEWLSQLHYYWKDEDLEIRMMNLKLNYCHEYLGSSDRLVITPLTQRCYRSLFNALTFHLDTIINGKPDHHLFPFLKSELGGVNFESVEEVKQAVHSFIRGQLKDFHARGIQKLFS
ncbi:unnamed protein product [Bemisia tabaci]|uniref:Dynein heavy chain hydrolytic ATP-binding dynein motor region domain-containing protein n=1 Tax=Bemisia tabaci TaxID=7038 RepID=A0A9P0A1W9_BEMTA|nr:unnamed protein product [Bemisia tabaci]